MPEILIPVIAAVIQSLITGCIKTDEQKAERLQSQVRAAWMPHKNRYKAVVFAPVWKSVGEEDTTTKMTDAGRKKVAFAILDRIRDAEADEVLAIVRETDVG